MQLMIQVNPDAQRASTASTPSTRRSGRARPGRAPPPPCLSAPSARRTHRTCRTHRTHHTQRPRLPPTSTPPCGPHASRTATSRSRCRPRRWSTAHYSVRAAGTCHRSLIPRTLRTAAGKTDPSDPSVPTDPTDRSEPSDRTEPSEASA